MAWRFKASKYKNATPIVPKPETCIRDICVGSYQTYGNNITASAAFMAFNVDHNGSSLAVLPLDDCGRKGKTMPLLHAHADTVTDMDFSPFHDGFLVTGSQDCLVKLWHIPEAGLEESLCNPECTFSHRQRRVEVVRWHPSAESLLTTVSYTNLSLWDVLSQKELFSNNEHKEVIQSISWRQDGSVIASTCKDKQVRIIDPRASKNIVHSACSHQSIKDSRVVWLGNTDRILTTGFNAARLRQVFIRDLRKLETPVKTLELDCSTGILMPLFDSDTNMLFLAGKGDTTITYMEVTDKDPHLVEGIRHSGEQTKGVCLVPKRALNVMQAEVNRILQLTSSMVIPIMYQVPRKSYRDFHADIYPDTTGYVANNTAHHWIQGNDLPVSKISLDPSKRKKEEEFITVHKGNLTTMKSNQLQSKLELHQQKAISISTPKGFIKSPTFIIEKEFELLEKLDNNFDSKDESKKLENEKNEDEKSTLHNGSGQVPPKPLPRSSRTNSLSDEEPKPVARPRTTSNPAPVVTSVNLNVIGGYKPRLGPKPFQTKAGNQEFSFDKVFSVPVAPVKENNGRYIGNDHVLSLDVNNEANLRNDPCEPDLSPKKYPELKKSDCGLIDQDSNSRESGYKSKTPSTTSVQKSIKPKSNDNLSNNEDSGVSEKNNSNKNSIAERRRVYESRSTSLTENMIADKTSSSPVPLRKKDSFKTKKDVCKKEENKVVILRQQSLETRAEKPQLVTTPTPAKRTSTVFGRVSKFRHLKGTPGHKSTHIENIRNISRQIYGECDGFHVNSDRAAIPLSGPGGKIAVLELKKTGKLPDGVIPALVHGATVMDFQWDPFDKQTLAVACDDGTIHVWEIPSSGLLQPTNVPTSTIEAHTDKIYLIKYHPLAKDVLASASYDMTVKIWDLQPLKNKGSAKAKIVLRGHTDQIFSLAWSPCGQFIATACKAGKIRIYKPRSSDKPVKEGKGPVGARGARVVWALEGRFLVATGFDKVSERQILIFKVDNLDTPLNTVGLDVSPAILMPYYDEDSSTLFLTGRGDSTIYVFEVTEEAPYCCPLSHHRCTSLHQGLSFLPKIRCDVANVEFATALRLTNNTIEPLSFTVPRIKSDLFQDDLFPPTKVTWEATMKSSEWFTGATKQPARINLKPPGMDNVTESQGQGVVTPSATSKNQSGLRGSTKWTDVRSKQNDIRKTLSDLIGDVINVPLEQDYMEGVDEHEWDE